jgi:bifunctional DNA primase/polymerase-like protein
MVEAVRRGRRRRDTDRLALAASGYAALGWPVCPGASPREGQPRQRHSRDRVPQQRHSQQTRAGHACSCDRVGCPAPGAHPLSPAWKLQATADPTVIGKWWNERPQASILLVTGRSFDVLDIPSAAGLVAIRQLERAGIRSGPVAVSAMERTLFFIATRAAEGDEDEWWSCNLDCEPEVLPEVTGLRWHCRDSYVVAPPSRLSNGMAARWLTEPDEQPLPDALRLLEVLADACEETA